MRKLLAALFTIISWPAEAQVNILSPVPSTAYVPSVPAGDPRFQNVIAVQDMANFVGGHLTSISVTPTPNTLSGPGILATSNNIFGTPSAPTGFLDVGWPFNSAICNDSGVNVSGFAVGVQTVPCISASYIGRATQGQGVGILGTAYVATSPAQASNVLNQFVGGQFIGQSTVNLGGTNLTSGAVGAVFGAGASAVAVGTTTNLLNVSGAEINAAIATGSSSKSFSVLSLAPLSNHAVAGGTYDADLSISSISGAIGVKNGILFSDYNGQQPIASAGCVICTQGSSTITTGLDFSTYTFTGNFINFGSNFSVTNVGVGTFGSFINVGTVSGTQAVQGAGANMVSRNSGNGAVTLGGQSAAAVTLGVSNSGILTLAATSMWTAIGSTAACIGTVGPAGIHATVQEWLTITDSVGTVRYIPAC